MFRSHIRELLVPMFGVAAAIALNAQAPPPPPPPPPLGLAPGSPSPCAAALLPAAAFDVVSIRPNPGGANGFSVSGRPDGGFTMVNGTLSMLIARGYSGYTQILRLPDWESSLRLDVTTTVDRANGVPTAEQRCAMARALLADRFKLQVHTETREEPAFDLVLARSDGKLGPSVTRSDIDCQVRAAEQRAAAEAAKAAGQPPPPPPAPGSFPMTGPLPPCSSRMSNNRFEGHMTMAALASILRSRVGRIVVDKTGLAGYFNVRLDAAPATTLNAVDAAAPGELPNVFTAVQEQLGLKLEASRTQVQVLVIDQVERPTEN